jgi:hypothetical protein
LIGIVTVYLTNTCYGSNAIEVSLTDNISNIPL